jgi:hypothetical protein
VIRLADEFFEKKAALLLAGFMRGGWVRLSGRGRLLAPLGSSGCFVSLESYLILKGLILSLFFKGSEILSFSSL